jgi:chaperonin GroEL
MNKEVLFGKESRDKMLLGVKKITKAVGVTMGAAGKCVLIGDSTYYDGFIVNLPTKISKDGFTVTKHFELQDPIEMRGAMMIKEAAMQTVNQAGDATTCTCVLAESLISNGIKLIDEGANSQLLKKGMDAALEYVVDELKKISVPIKGDIEKIRQIATVSANNDESVGNLIADAFSKIGADGIIDIEASKGVTTEIKISEGYKFDRGWISPLFVNNRDKQLWEVLDPLILLYEKRVTHHTQVENACVLAMKAGKPLLIVCEDADENGLAFLAMNVAQGRIKVCAVKSPFGSTSREDMEDIATLTGGVFICDSKGVGVKEVTMSDLGTAKKVIVSKNETVIIGGNSDAEALTNLLNELRMNLAQAKDEEEKAPIEKRIAKLTGGVAVIQVGAATETELNEKMDRVDDAVRATKAAIAEGFVAGGGTAFLRIPFSGYDITSDFNKGKGLVFTALESPLKQICKNAGTDVENIFKLVSEGKGNMGYNALTDEIVDMVEDGIIDSTKALRCALTNAVSVAGMLLTSECSIISIS